MVSKIGFVRNADRLVLAVATALLLLSGTAVAHLALTGKLPVEGIGVPVSQRISNFEKESAISNKSTSSSISTSSPTNDARVSTPVGHHRSIEGTA
jgi:hypothetical protein